MYIALPNTQHAAWTIRAADAGLHVLCEKPLATSVLDCERMIEACERNGVHLMTAYRLHFERCNLEVADIVRRKRIGEARYFDAQFSMQVKAGNIRLKRELGGGPEWDIGIYCQNAARYVFADEPTQVWATATNSGDARFTEVPETVHVIMKFPGERIANFVCSFGAADRSRYEIVGTKGSVVCDPAFEYAEGLSYELKVGEKKKRKKFAKSDQFAPELVHFAKCVRANRPPEPSGIEGLIDVAIIEAIHRSIATGGWAAVEAPQKRRRPSLRQEMRDRRCRANPTGSSGERSSLSQRKTATATDELEKPKRGCARPLEWRHQLQPHPHPGEPAHRRAGAPDRSQPARQARLRAGRLPALQQGHRQGGRVERRRKGV